MVVVSLSLPHAARNAARAVEPPVTASSLRRETGSLATRDNALGLLSTDMLPPRSRVIDPTYGERTGVDQPPAIEFSDGSALGGRTGADALKRPRDACHALGDPLGRHAGKGEAQAVGAALDHEVGAGDEGNSLALGLGRQSAGVGALLQIQPEEVATAGDDELGLGKLLAQGPDEGVAAGLKRPLDEIDVPVEAARAAEPETAGPGHQC